MIGDMGSTARGSGARLNTGKPNLSLIPLGVLDDAARVFEYGMNKYANRRGCTCSVANALRTSPSSSTTATPSAPLATTGSYTTAVPPTESSEKPTPPNTPSESPTSDGPQIGNTTTSPTPSARSSSTTSSEPTDWTPLIMSTLSQEDAASAAPSTSSGSITATPTDMYEVPFATLVTSGLGSWRDLTDGLTAHSSTCGLRDADLSSGLWNWAKGMKWSVVISSLLRHVAAIQMGELLDPESELPHTGHLMCNAIMICHYYRYFPELNDFANANLLAYRKEPTHV